MANTMQTLTPDEQANNAIRTGWDSVNVVNEIVNSSNAANMHSEQVDTRVWANYKHLEIVLKRENVVSYLANNTTIDMSQWHTAINVGKTYVTGSQWVDANTI
jgi:hypothetical protein